MAAWIVVCIPQEEQIESTFGPFASPKEAQAWIDANESCPNDHDIAALMPV